MARRDKKNMREDYDKVLDVDASMQGTLSFKDPVNLRINGNFEGRLVIKGSLTIGEAAQVQADIDGEVVRIAGSVMGDVIARKRLELVAPARMIGNVTTPALVVGEGAVLEGNCKMLSDKFTDDSSKKMTAGEVARYLEVDDSKITNWAENGKIPGQKVGDSWLFDREEIDEWVNAERIR